MRPSGWVFFTASAIFIIVLTAWSFWKLFTKKDQKTPPPQTP